MDIRQEVINPQEFKEYHEDIIYPIINIGDLSKIDDWIINLIYKITTRFQGDKLTIIYDINNESRIMNKCSLNLCRLTDILNIVKSYKIIKEDLSERLIVSMPELVEEVKTWNL